jgi:phage tail-like protein
MPQFAVNPERLDPYKNFKFRIKWDGQYVAGVSSITALRRVTDVVEHREGGAPNAIHKSPGVTRFDAITLERGRTHDTAFELWANRVGNMSAGPEHEIALGDFRKNVVIELFNEAGQLVMAWNVYRCWPSEYVAVSDLDANGDSAHVFERLTLQHEGWERDLAVTEPQEPD